MLVFFLKKRKINWCSCRKKIGFGNVRRTNNVFKILGSHGSQIKPKKKKEARSVTRHIPHPMFQGEELQEQIVHPHLQQLHYYLLLIQGVSNFQTNYL